mmetsp:Transcript_111047/g.319125  ORF Transcript_111047/g.319125 Transcript_111047/m.319125 type:complete len:240 (+) Transcript_111047:305-1024(+)
MAVRRATSRAEAVWCSVIFCPRRSREVALPSSSRAMGWELRLAVSGSPDSTCKVSECARWTGRIVIIRLPPLLALAGGSELSGAPGLVSSKSCVEKGSSRTSIWTKASSAMASCKWPKLMRRLARREDVAMTPSTPSFLNFAVGRPSGPSATSSSSKHAFSDNLAVRCVLGRMRRIRRLFISICISCAGRSLTSSPKGFSNSPAMAFKDQSTNTCTNVPIPAHNALFTHMHVRKGVESQ